MMICTLKFKEWLDANKPFAEPMSTRANEIKKTSYFSYKSMNAFFLKQKLYFLNFIDPLNDMQQYFFHHFISVINSVHL